MNKEKAKEYILGTQMYIKHRREDKLINSTVASFINDYLNKALKELEG